MNDKSMKNALPTPTPVALLMIRWTARLIALAICALVLTIIFGEGDLFSRRSPMEWLMTALFLISIIGLFLGWRWESLGGVLSVTGMCGFYLTHYWTSNFTRWPGGWVFPCFFIPGILYVLCAVLERRRHWIESR